MANHPGRKRARNIAYEHIGIANDKRIRALAVTDKQGENINTIKNALRKVNR